MSRNQHKGRPAKPSTSHSTKGQGEVRIIAGDWRSRVLRFPDEGGVRPSPARTRETLFNWLNFHLAGSHCLDLFSGSGVLGLEALSRGAARAAFVDHTPALARALRANLQLLKSENGEVYCEDVLAFLAHPPVKAADIVFVDPPFRQQWLEKLMPLIHQNGWIQPGGWVYLEYESERAAPSVPANWHLHRQKQAGQVTFALYRSSQPAAEEDPAGRSE